MTIADLLKKCSYEKIKEKFVLHYGDEKLREFKSLYNWMTILKPSVSPDRRLYISVNAYDMEGRELEHFNENNPDVDFDVYAYEKKNKKFRDSGARFDATHDGMSERAGTTGSGRNTGNYCGRSHGTGRSNRRNSRSTPT